jgi:hypothetical protein
MIFLATVIIALITGCATQVTEQPTETQRSSIKLGEFKKVILVKSAMPPELAEQGANIKAANKIDETLGLRIKGLFSNVSYATSDELKAMSFSQLSKGDTLVIKPNIKQIKFIGGAARFWAGAMAGSSVVVMDVTFNDAATSEIIGKTGTYRKAGAYSDVFGVASNRMLEDAAQDIMYYITANQ